jgi:hypothetical protein
VTRVAVDPFKAVSTIDLFMRVNQDERRSGWAPAARVTDYVDNGVGAPAGTRHELVLDTGHYANDIAINSRLPCMALFPTHAPGVKNEGHFFLPGMLIRLTEWDDDTGPLLGDNLEVSAVAHTADGGSVYVTAAPANDPGAGGTWLIHFRDYSTANQTAAAMAYVHVCDETTGQIGATGDAGFKPT